MSEYPTSEYKLNNPPKDGISHVEFGSESSQYLLVSSWDNYVRIYDVINNNLRVKYSHSMPVLNCCFQDSNCIWSGGLDKTLVSFDVVSSTESVIGKHEQAIRCVSYCESAKTIITGSWDASIKLWDARSNKLCIGTYGQPNKVYTMSLAGETLVVGTAERKVWVWDLRNMAYVQQKRESSLKFQTRCISCFPNKQGYVLSSIEGRVAVEYLDPSPEVQKRKYAFKSHRNKENGVEYIYPVNTISFHREHHTFATGGSDGLVNVWDGSNKKRLCQFHRYPSSINSLSFSPSGSSLAIACSYMFEQKNPPDPLPEIGIYIRRVTDQETKPKD